MGLLSLLFPKLCFGCGRLGSYLCQKCQEDIAQNELVCPRCERLSIGGRVHPLCKSRYGLDGLWSLGIYQNPLKKVIQGVKYRLVQEAVITLVDLMVVYWAKWTPEFLDEVKNGQWVVVPVPLHKSRQRFRGFNQSAELGKILAAKIGLEYAEVLVRVKNTRPQVGLRGKQRKQNIRGAFTVNCSLSPVNCLLIDDVWTTGSTLKECCYELKRAGSKKVWAITLAR